MLQLRSSLASLHWMKPSQRKFLGTQCPLRQRNWCFRSHPAFSHIQWNSQCRMFVFLLLLNCFIIRSVLFRRLPILPSVRLSVCPSITYELLSWKQKTYENRNWCDRYMGQEKTVWQLKNSKWRQSRTGCKFLTGQGVQEGAAPLCRNDFFLSVL